MAANVNRLSALTAGRAVLRLRRFITRRFLCLGGGTSRVFLTRRSVHSLTLKAIVQAELIGLHALPTNCNLPIRPTSAIPCWSTISMPVFRRGRDPHLHHLLFAAGAIASASVPRRCRWKSSARLLKGMGQEYIVNRRPVVSTPAASSGLGSTRPAYAVHRRLATTTTGSAVRSEDRAHRRVQAPAGRLNRLILRREVSETQDPPEQSGGFFCDSG